MKNWITYSILQESVFDFLTRYFDILEKERQNRNYGTLWLVVNEPTLKYFEEELSKCSPQEELDIEYKWAAKYKLNKYMNDFEVAFMMDEIGTTYTYILPAEF